MTVEKACTGCHLTKPASEFSKCNSAKDGLQRKCKGCERAYRDANKDAVRERQRKYDETNRAARLKRQRQYRDANKDLVREQRQQYRERSNRRFRDGGRSADMPWPDRPISYSAAHYRVKAIHGAAGNHPCIACGNQAHTWAYDHSDPNPLISKGVGRFDGKTYPYSLDPERYDPLCRGCHIKRDRYGAA